MPHIWTDTDTSSELKLWPHNSLPAEGFAVMIMTFFLFATIPLYWMIGTWLFWALLPFVMAAVAALYYALRRNARDRQILEVLTLDAQQAQLTRTNPKGDTQSWQSNTYWVTAELHEKGGPVPFYVTLKGAGREVEIGAFLSEDERKALFDDLQRALLRYARA